MGWFYPWCNAFDTSGIIQGWNGSNTFKQRTISCSLTCQILYLCSWHNQSQSSTPRAWVAEVWGEFRWLCTSRSCSTSGQVPAVFALWSCYAQGALPELVSVAWSLPHGVAGVANNRAGLACPATYLPLSNAEPFCGLSKSCWSWGESPSYLGWCPQ